MKNSIISVLIAISMSLLALTGCSSNTQQGNTTIGAVSGAVVGGLAGTAFGAGTGRAVAVGVGAVAGALFGGWIGHEMDHSDNTRCCHTLDRNAPNHPHTWKNKRTGAQYTVKPTSRVMTYNGNNYCRQYETTATMNGKTQTSSGIACRQANGSWQVVS
jgi:surface antigen